MDDREGGGGTEAFAFRCEFKKKASAASSSLAIDVCLCLCLWFLATADALTLFRSPNRDVFTLYTIYLYICMYVYMWGPYI